MNPPLETIPEHLREYITEQDPSLYTPIDHAVWRYFMRVSQAFFAKHGHPLFGQGLVATGISTDRVPLISEMDAALRKMGWRAVAINGFIPPSIFLEFQALRILAIACDIRKLENIGYTPSPDIIHEAGGHVPIVADPAYRAYLEAYGEVARNAIITKYDLELYEAVFELSEIKENPRSTRDQIAAAQKKFEEVAGREVKPSEAALLTRMAWWTTEYGLIEMDGTPRIFGAGLLSSVSESYHCLRPEVKKIPFSVNACIQTSYDITRPQPQLFVARSFEQLIQGLQEFASTMGYRRGGRYGLELAIEAENTVTAVLDSGVQLSGVIGSAHYTAEGDECAFTLRGTRQFSFQDEANDSMTHLPLPKEILIPLFPDSILQANPEDIERKLHGSGLHAKGGFRVQGRVQKTVRMGNTARVLLLEQARIFDSANRLLLSESGKLLPLPLASRVTSVFGGAADRRNFVLRNQKVSKKVHSHETNLTAENTTLNFLYRQVRDFRDSGNTDVRYLEAVIRQLDEYFPEDWLLRLELYELFKKWGPDHVAAAALHKRLCALQEKDPDRREMIGRGLELL
jgi:phenylalanine-4-hydroxylase